MRFHQRRVARQLRSYRVGGVEEFVTRRVTVTIVDITLRVMKCDSISVALQGSSEVTKWAALKNSSLGE